MRAGTARILFHGDLRFAPDSIRWRRPALSGSARPTGEVLEAAEDPYHVGRPGAKRPPVAFQGVVP